MTGRDRAFLSGMFAGAAVVAFAVSTVSAWRTWTADSYALVGVDDRGEAWTRDTGLTLEDCRKAPDTGDAVQWCELESE